MKRNGMVWLCAAVVMAAPTISAAWAQQAQAKSSGDALPNFAQLDKDGNGQVSRSEVPTNLHDLRAHFDQYGGQDHRLSQGEYENYMARVNDAACRSDQYIKFASCPTRGPRSSGFSNVPKVSNNHPKAPAGNNR